MNTRSVVVALSGFTLLMLASGCKPTYPKCDKDEHCRDGEFCVNGMCQQCRENADCGKGQKCNKGRCEALDGYCETLDDCPNRQACINNKCTACKADADCGEGIKCKKGQCLRAGQCVDNSDCPENNECQNGICVAPPGDGGGAPCTPPTVYFDFNESVLTSEATAKIQEGAACMKRVPNRTIRVEGHCDPRGTEEYNLALGDRRAQSVKKYLQRMGVNPTIMRTVSKGKLEARGENESGWALDRKVQFIWE